MRSVEVGIHQSHHDTSIDFESGRAPGRLPPVPRHNDSMLSRAPGKGRYSQLEREQRWLLNELPRHRHDPVQILDHYLTDTRLRLRRMQSDQEVLWKLGQKVRERSAFPEVVRLTNIYLSEQEYLALVTNATVLSKTRWHWEFSGRSMAADDFHGTSLASFSLKWRLDPDDERLGTPPGSIADVTNDDRSREARSPHLANRVRRL